MAFEDGELGSATPAARTTPQIAAMSKDASPAIRACPSHRRDKQTIFRLVIDPN